MEEVHLAGHIKPPLGLPHWMAFPKINVPLHLHILPVLASYGTWEISNMQERSLNQKMVCDQANSCESFKVELRVPIWVKIVRSSY